MKYIQLNQLTPVQRCSNGLLLKRDDLFQPLKEINVNGTKLRECIVLLKENIEQCRKYGVITGTSIHSPQSVIVASACKLLNVKCTCIFGGTSIERIKELGLYKVLNELLGAAIEIPCKSGRTNILQSYINKRTMETNEFIVKYGINIINEKILEDSVGYQVSNIPQIKNLCCVCGSGITTIGILNALKKYKTKIDNIYLFGTAPNRMKLINKKCNNLLNYNEYISKIHYIDLHSEKGFVYEHKEPASIDGIPLHSMYEAKAFKRMQEMGLNNEESLLYIIGQEINI